MIKFIVKLAFWIVAKHAVKNDYFIVRSRSHIGVCELTGKYGQLLEAPHLCFKNVCPEEYMRDLLNMEPWDDSSK